MKIPKKSNSRFEESRGFALVVTLSLMILLTILAVGLLSIASISMRGATQAAAMSEARQNARMALMLAIGELQKQAGPDQRSTAVADLAGTSSGDSLAAGGAPANNLSINSVNKGLSGIQDGTRYWTGVWRNNNTSATAGTEIYTKTPSPKFVQWLISGNETAEATIHSPASALCSLGSGGKISDPTKAVVLVGQNTAGSSGGAATARYVAAPLVPIQKPDASTTRETGRYGWWIGDEGVKAKINLPQTVTDNTSYASLTAQRRGWETVSGFTDYPTPDSATHGSLPKVTSLAQTALLGTGGASSGGDTGLQSVFHSATTDSRGLLVDAYNGGTKIDLTSILTGGLPTTNPVPAVINYPARGTNIIPRAGGTRMVAPKWDAMKEFYDRGRSLESGALIVKQATAANNGSIAPLITDLRVLLGVKFTAATSGTGVKATACGKIAVAIANPYSRPLRWKNDMELELRDITPAGNRPARIYNLGDSAPFFDRNLPSLFNNLFFRIRAGELAPGEARAYTLSGYTLRPAGSVVRSVAELGSFSSSLPFDFSRCVELDSATVWTSMPSLDVRESWQTTLVMAELKIAGSSTNSPPLRRVERFDLDNGYFGANTRNYTIDDCKKRTKPVPLMSFSFQLSQPGADYLSLMPSGYELGQRSSSMRTFMDFNLQGTRFGKPIASYNPPPYFMESNNGFAQLPDTPPGGDTGTTFTRNLSTVMPWGRSFTGPKNTILFSVPDRVDSLAQFQHADLTGDDVAASIGHQPGNAFANSYATPFVKRTLTVQPRADYEIIGSPNPSGATNYQLNPMGVTGIPQGPRNYYDIAYLLNAAIWDSYFLSTVSSGSRLFENPSMIPVDGKVRSADLTDPVECATKTMIDGAFNVNCTDKNAWKAFLGSSKHFAHRADAGGSAGAAFPRTLEQTSPAANPPTGTGDDSYAGFRRLTDNELDQLATEIVKQVRLRGPFVSLAQFVNRSIGDIRRQPTQTRCGPLQYAIDESGLTINFAGNRKALAGVNASTDRVNLTEKQGAPRADMDGTDAADRPADADPSTPDWAMVSTDNNFGAVASIVADRAMLSSSKNEQGYRSTGIPGWLTQADVLQVIGPSLSVRSDTFRVRGYGESLDKSGNTLAKAYCEAIVQRMPEYVDTANAASERGNSLSNLNKTYGRKFALVSFRWLSEKEI